MSQCLGPSLALPHCSDSQVPIEDMFMLHNHFQIIKFYNWETENDVKFRCVCPYTNLNLNIKHQCVCASVMPCYRIPGHILVSMICNPVFIYLWISGEPIYESCLSKVEKMIYKRVQKAEEVKDMEFYAFSYYYDRAVDLGLVGMHCTVHLRIVDFVLISYSLTAFLTRWSLWVRWEEGRLTSSKQLCGWCQIR